MCTEKYSIYPLFVVQVAKGNIMDKQENILDDDFFPLETKNTKSSFTRTGNFRRNVRKKYNAQRSDPGHTPRLEEYFKPVTKSNTMPNMPQFGCRGSLSSENNSDSSFTSLVNSPDTSEKDKGFEGSTADSSPNVVFEETDSFSTFAEDTISDINKRIEKLQNTAKDCDKVNNQTDNTNFVDLSAEGSDQDKSSNLPQVSVVSDDNCDNKFSELIKEQGLGDKTIDSDTGKAALDESLQVIGSAAASLGVDIAKGVGFLGKAAAGAWDFFSSTLDQLKSADSDSDNESNWHDVGSDVSEEGEINFFDANEDHKVSI